MHWACIASAYLEQSATLVVCISSRIGLQRVRRIAAVRRDICTINRIWFLNISESSKFFGPSPRKHRLTVYRGFQVWPLFRIIENHEKLMIVKSIQEHSGDVEESLGMFLSDPRCSRMIPDDFQKSWFFEDFHDFRMCHLDVIRWSGD